LNYHESPIYLLNANVRTNRTANMWQLLNQGGKWFSGCSHKFVLVSMDENGTDIYSTIRLSKWIWTITVSVGYQIIRIKVGYIWPAQVGYYPTSTHRPAARRIARSQSDSSTRTTRVCNISWLLAFFKGSDRVWLGPSSFTIVSLGLGVSRWLNRTSSVPRWFTFLSCFLNFVCQDK
jgi:hypothetical protein